MPPSRTDPATSRWAWFARRLAVVVAAIALAGVGWAWWASILPGTYSAMDVGVPDYGGGPGSAALHAGAHGGRTADGAAAGAAPAAVTGTANDLATMSVIDLVADPGRPADVRVELVARSERITPDGGEPFDGFTLNGESPGPAIRATEGQLVEVVLRNDDVPDGVTLHWHGVDVPAAMDGVAGVTQDAVRAGDSFTYRFVAEQSGTFWYHSHQASHPQVVGGLFGAVILEPAAGTTDAVADVVAAIHTYPGGQRTLNGATGDGHHRAEPGGTVRVRLINTDSTPTSAWVTGSAFRVLAIDGQDLHGPGEVEGRAVELTAGARADLEVRVPVEGAVRVQVPGASLIVGPDGAQADTSSAPRESVDVLAYGEPADTGIDPADADRTFTYDIGRLPGFLDGLPGYWWTINGGILPAVPMYMVDEGDIVVMRIANNSGEVHPMHLHGHHLLVLSRDGQPSTGSPWWVDSLDVEHGESYEVAFTADNPGIWMDHCHNLPHASEGLMTHLAYTGITTPFRLGRDSGNDPE